MKFISILFDSSTNSQAFGQKKNNKWLKYTLFYIN